MLLLLQLLFILFVTFYIGWRVGQSVPDEIVPARQWLEWGIHALFAAALGVTLWGFDQRILAVALAILILVAKRWVPFEHVHAAAGGLLLALATLLPSPLLIMVAVLVLTMNFLLGATTNKIRALTHNAARQPITAVVVGVVLLFL